MHTGFACNPNEKQKCAHKRVDMRRPTPDEAHRDTKGGEERKNEKRRREAIETQREDKRHVLSRTEITGRDTSFSPPFCARGFLSALTPSLPAASRIFLPCLAKECQVAFCSPFSRLKKRDDVPCATETKRLATLTKIDRRSRRPFLLKPPCRLPFVSAVSPATR